MPVSAEKSSIRSRTAVVLATASVFAVAISAVHKYLTALPRPAHEKTSSRWWALPWPFRSIVQPLPEPTTDPVKSFKLLSYNAFLRPILVHSNANDFKEERFAELLKVIHHWDIICLQELFCLSSTRPWRLLRAASAAGLQYYAAPAAPSLFSNHWIDAGLLILSRFPILETDVHIYTVGEQIDRYAAKQCIYAKISLGSDWIHVVTTHLQAHYFTNTAEQNSKNEAAKEGQLRQLADFVRKKAKDGRPLVLTGDLNLNARPNDPALSPHNEHYLNFLDLLGGFGEFSVKNVIFDAHGEHPVTFGDVVVLPCGKREPKEIVLTAPSDHMIEEALDYVVVVQGTAASAASGSEWSKNGDVVAPICTLGVETAKVNEMCVPDGLPFRQMSDHYAIDVHFAVTTDDIEAQVLARAS